MTTSRFLPSLLLLAAGLALMSACGRAASPGSGLGGPLPGGAAPRPDWERTYAWRGGTRIAGFDAMLDEAAALAAACPTPGRGLQFVHAAYVDARGHWFPELSTDPWSAVFRAADGGRVEVDAYGDRCTVAWHRFHDTPGLPLGVPSPTPAPIEPASAVGARAAIAAAVTAGADGRARHDLWFHARSEAVAGPHYVVEERWDAPGAAAPGYVRRRVVVDAPTGKVLVKTPRMFLAAPSTGVQPFDVHVEGVAGAGRLLNAVVTYVPAGEARLRP